MPSIHWTYKVYDDPSENLAQGDILARTPELLHVLSQCHSYFEDSRYIGFMVVTQSCDLVLRNGSIGAPYITLAVIRELDPLLPRLLDDVCRTPHQHVYDDDRFELAVSKLTTLINQNEQARGLFYLHPISDASDRIDILATRSVALLRVKFSLRSEHYEILRNSRRLGLADPYASKLGWLVGNLYSRVATPDWEDMETNSAASKEQAKNILSTITTPDRENWVSGKELAAKLKIHREAISEFRPETFRSDLSALEFESPAEIAADEATEKAIELALQLMDSQLISEFGNDAELKELIGSGGFEPELSEDQRATIDGDKKIIEKLASSICKLCLKIVDIVEWDEYDSPQEWSEALASLLKSRIQESDFASAKSRIMHALGSTNGNQQINVPDLATDSIKDRIAMLTATHWLRIRECRQKMSRLSGRLLNSSRFKDNTKKI